MLLGIPLCLLTASFAHRKGYNPFIWFFAGGLIGLVALAFLPHVTTPGTDGNDEESHKRLVKGNSVGGVIVAIAVGLSICFWFMEK